jgi:hypothetical protein
MTKTDADQYRTGVWPGRLMSAFEPLPAPLPPRRSRVRRAFEIAGKVIAVLVLISGVAYLLGTATGQI